jgi:NhaP-type Na+/H+ or K+/H+ antiporter
MGFEIGHRPADVPAKLDGDSFASVVAFACISFVFLTLGIIASCIR